ncbi:MAG: signal peptidase I [Desulfobacteraceae bacterium]|nr:signal peptidase I [Desulfobacteraceae bacterium]
MKSITPPAATGNGADRRLGAIVWEYAQAIIIALVLAMIIRTFVVQAFEIPSGSMIHTLLIGDHLLVNKFIYGVRNPFNNELWIKGQSPHRGDIIVFVYPLDPSKDFIKRVIGIGGDTVEIVNKKVYVNGKLFPDPPGVQYTDPRILPASVQPRDNMGPIVVPKDSLFVMGDNRDQSYDSRFWGFVPLKNVKGKALIIYWSWNPDNFKPRFDRMFKIIK